MCVPGSTAFAACLWAVIIIIGIVLQISPDALGPHNNDPEELSDLGMTIFAAGLLPGCVAFAICLILVGKSISQKETIHLLPRDRGIRLPVLSIRDSPWDLHPDRFGPSLG